MTGARLPAPVWPPCRTARSPRRSSCLYRRLRPSGRWGGYPGPGAGLLLAYAIFGTGLAKNTAPAAFIIQFFGGIHEIYFPYVLLKPLTLLATIAGGMVGIFTLVVFGAGLRAPAAPGSIIAVYAQTPGNSFVGVTLSVLFAAT